MTDPMTLSGNANELDAVRVQLIDGSERVQQQLLPQITGLGEAGDDIFMEFLLKRSGNPPKWIDGKVYQILRTANSERVKAFLQTHFPQGVVPLLSEVGIDYQPLQELLVNQDFEAADRLTMQKMCELAGEAAIQRKWLYFTEVDSFPVTDLQTINNLWVVYSEGKFGFSVQRELWLGLGKNWDNLWAKIGWKNGNNWTRYPNGFTWDLTAPKGHLPLSNQLRGVRVIAALFAHPAWDK
ncbi:GUN4 domain-containing protein [Calothrix sp. NIES-3974]|uniref:GUN4 domain-containing protein n=1 Tax=Calothrix sp. NIES-3974 TaxID=2005462 RepID=UPI000B5FAF23|nr:GUN4 domain-containing protein [Calothrix sp. NIES-3974]BAZ04757.1 GUN4 domain-containing protein [Calothrix sp. NIES-3974]